MPRTFLPFFIAMLAIAGIPGLSGFFSKDEILAGAWNSGNKVVWGLLSFAALITAFYMMRLTYLVFFGKYRGSAESWKKVHESTPLMTIPLAILGVLSIVGGYIGVPAVMSGWIGMGDVNKLHHWLAPVITEVGGGHGGGHGADAAHGGAAHHDAGVETLLIVLASTIAALGIGMAWMIYKKEGAGEKWAKRFGPIYTLVRNLYWVDELYERIILRPYYALCRLFAAFDRWVVDGLVNAVGVTVEISGQVIKLFQTGLVRNYALMFLFGAVVLIYYVVSALL